MTSHAEQPSVGISELFTQSQRAWERSPKEGEEFRKELRKLADWARRYSLRFGVAATGALILYMFLGMFVFAVAIKASAAVLVQLLTAVVIRHTVAIADEHQKEAENQLQSLRKLLRDATNTP